MNRLGLSDSGFPSLRGKSWYLLTAEFAENAEFRESYLLCNAIFSIISAPSACSPVGPGICSPVCFPLALCILFSHKQTTSNTSRQGSVPVSRVRR